MSKLLKNHKAIKPLYINGLNGRMLDLPNADTKREILFIYGHHASIERMMSLAEELQDYGSVTLPDLPGFGGMESFYKLGEKPTLDNMADYLAAFVKMRYSHKKVTIIAVSYGFNVATRMLQRCPDLANKVDLLVSIVGFTHHQDFKFKPKTTRLLKTGATFFSKRVPAWFGQHVLLTKPLITTTYKLVSNRHVKMKGVSSKELNRRIAFEIVLWKLNDLRTHMFTSLHMLDINLCNKKVALPVYHVGVEADQYFDNYLVEQHLNVIFDTVTMLEADLHAHMPTIVASRKEIAPLIPDALRTVLQEKP